MNEGMQQITLQGKVYTFPARIKFIEIIEGNPQVGDEMMVLNYEIINGTAEFRNVTYRVLTEEEINRRRTTYNPYAI
jgi:hypothetical protein